MGVGPDPETSAPAGAERLTPRERQVIALVCEGLSNQELAARLGVSQGTIRRHTSSIYAKLGAANRAQAAAIWVVGTLHHSG